MPTARPGFTVEPGTVCSDVTRARCEQATAVVLDSRRSWSRLSKSDRKGSIQPPLLDRAALILLFSGAPPVLGGRRNELARPGPEGGSRRGLPDLGSATATRRGRLVAHPTRRRRARDHLARNADRRASAVAVSRRARAWLPHACQPSVWVSFPELSRSRRPCAWARRHAPTIRYVRMRLVAGRRERSPKRPEKAR